jgi:thiol-disulfide isomerase/thioredoxin
MTDGVPELTPKTLENALLNHKKVFLKLWKKGCGACKMSDPAVSRLASARGEDIFFAQISVTDFPEMYEIAETDVLPVFFAFQNQKLTGKMVGFKGIKALEEFIDLNLV